MKLKFTLVPFAAFLFFLFSSSARVDAQCTPAIPSTTYVLSGGSNDHGLGPNIWICPGGDDTTNSIGDTTYLEGGAILYGLNGINNVVYVSPGAQLKYDAGAIGNQIYFVDSSDLSAGIGNNNTLHQCTTIAFDYTNAPSPGCINTGIVNKTTSSGFEVYPNPATNELWVTGPVSGVGTTTVEIANILGGKIYRTKLITQNSQPKTRVDVSSLPTGIYIVELSNVEKIYRAKFVKE